MTSTVRATARGTEERPKPVRHAPDAVDPATAPARAPLGPPQLPPRPCRRAAPCASRSPWRAPSRPRRLLWTVSTPTDVYAIDVFGALRLPGEAAAIIGHRGDRSEAPENTMPALELALDDLAYVETDVRLTRDGVPVLFHDTDLERVAGRDGASSDLDLADVRDSTSVRGTPTTGRARYRRSTRSSPRSPSATRPRPRRAQGRWAPHEVRRVLDLVERHGLRGRVVLQSFSIETLQSVQRVAPTTPRIMLIRELPADPVPLAEQLGIIGFGTTAASVTAAPDAVDLAHAAGIAVLCYTLNTREHVGAGSASGSTASSPTSRATSTHGSP